MDCESARLEISTAIDSGVAVSSEVEAHVAGCGSCRRWQEGVHQLRRATLRTVSDSVAGEVDLQVLPQRFRIHRWVRMALAWTGLLLILWNLIDMFSRGSGSAIHLERHQAAFSVALGIAFVFVAWRPDRAYGMVPFAVTFTMALSIAALIDLFNGSSTMLRESAHLVEILGLALLWVLGLAVGPGRVGKARPSGS